MTTLITQSSVTDNLAPLTTSPESLNSEVGRLSGSNSALINSTKVDQQRVEDHIGMTHANMADKLSLVHPSDEQIQARLKQQDSGSVEARKARASGDEVESDDGNEKSGDVENDHHEDVSGGRRVHPVYGLYEEA